MSVSFKLQRVGYSIFTLINLGKFWLMNRLEQIEKHFIFISKCSLDASINSIISDFSWRTMLTEVVSWTNLKAASHMLEFIRGLIFWARPQKKLTLKHDDWVTKKSLELEWYHALGTSVFFSTSFEKWNWRNNKRFGFLGWESEGKHMHSNNERICNFFSHLPQNFAINALPPTYFNLGENSMSMYSSTFFPKIKFSFF